MRFPKYLAVKVDEETDKTLRKFAEERGLTICSATRMLILHSLNDYMYEGEVHAEQ